MNPNSLRNLEKGRVTRFRPGTSGNPGGRPRIKPVTEASERTVLLPVPEEDRKKLGLPKGATWADAVAHGQIRAAAKGSAPSATYVRETVEGKMPQTVTLDDEEGRGPDDLEARLKHLQELCDALR